MDVLCIPESGCCFLFVPLFFISLSNFQRLKCFVTCLPGTVRPTKLKLGSHVDSGCMYRVYQNQTAALICPFISSFFFLSKFQTFKIFAIFFSGTVMPTKLKLGTHVNNRLIYCVWQNQAAGAYSSLYLFIFLSLLCPNIEIFFT